MGFHFAGFSAGSSQHFGTAGLLFPALLDGMGKRSPHSRDRVANEFFENFFRIRGFAYPVGYEFQIL